MLPRRALAHEETRRGAEAGACVAEPAGGRHRHAAPSSCTMGEERGRPLRASATWCSSGGIAEEGIDSKPTSLPLTACAVPSGRSRRAAVREIRPGVLTGEGGRPGPPGQGPESHGCTLSDSLEPATRACLRLHRTGRGRIPVGHDRFAASPSQCPIAREERGSDCVGRLARAALSWRLDPARCQVRELVSRRWMQMEVKRETG